MALLGQSAFLKALGWALLNSIWQMGLLWMIFLLLTACMRKLTAQMKHSLAVVLLGSGFCWFAFTLAGQYLIYSEDPLIITLANQEASNQNVISLFGSLTGALEFSLPYLSIVYLGAALFLFFRFATQYRYTNFLCTQNVHKPSADLRVFVLQIAERMGIKKSIRLWLSEIVDTPMVIGYLKPVILMPIASVHGLSISQIEAIVLHELSHIKRNDYLVNLLIASIDIILFFNPFSKLFVRSIKKEREHSCDDLVMQFEYNPHAYASALLTIEQKRVMKLSLAMAATGRNNQLLLDRVKRILNQPVSQQYTNRMVPMLFSAFMVGFIAWSNPGNIIVRQILKIENPKPVVSAQSEIREIAIESPAARKNSPAFKKHRPAMMVQDPEKNMETQPDALSTLSEYELTPANNYQFAPAVIQA